MGWTRFVVCCILMDTTSAWALITWALSVSYRIIIPGSAQRKSAVMSHQACRSLSYSKCEFHTDLAHPCNWSTHVSLFPQASQLTVTDCSFPCHAVSIPRVTDSSVPSWMFLATLDKYDCREESMTRRSSSGKPLNFHTCQNLQGLMAVSESIRRWWQIGLELCYTLQSR